MSLGEIVSQFGIPVGGVLFVILSLIKFPKCEVNFFGWIGRKIKKLLTDDIVEKLNQLEKKTDTITEQLELHKEEHEKEAMIQARAKILRFNDEILYDIKHSQEHFDEIINYIDRYEQYCVKHPEFKNNKAVLSIKNIKEIYEMCQKENKFL